MSERLREVALASASPRRYDLLRSLGLDVTVVRSAYEEDNVMERGRDPRDLVLAHAAGKAAHAAPHGPALLIAADTIVVVDGDVLGKPADAADAARMLARLSGREHDVHTGFAVIDRATGRQASGVESARVRFLPLDADRIARYVGSGEPLDKAGAYGIQGLGALNVASIEGDFYTVMGLPLARLGEACGLLGFQLL